MDLHSVLVTIVLFLKQNLMKYFPLAKDATNPSAADVNLYLVVSPLSNNSQF